MSEGLNRVLLLGNLCADPELKSYAGGALLKMRLACSEVYFDRNGQKQEKTEFVSIVLFGEKRTEALSALLGKGDRVFVEGKLQTSSWTTKDGAGEKRYRTEVVALNVILNGKASGRRVSHESPPDLGAPPAAEDFGAYDFGDEEPPF